MIICNCPFFLDEKKYVIYCEALKEENVSRFVDRIKANELRFDSSKEKRDFQCCYCSKISPIQCKRYNDLLKKYD